MSDFPLDQLEKFQKNVRQQIQTTFHLFNQIYLLGYGKKIKNKKVCFCLKNIRSWPYAMCHYLYDFWFFLGKIGEQYRINDHNSVILTLRPIELEYFMGAQEMMLIFHFWYFYVMVWTSKSNQKVVHWVDLLGQLLSQNDFFLDFQIFSLKYTVVQ